MSPTIRKKHGSRFKAKVAFAAIRNEETLGQLGRRYGLTAGQVGKWRQELISRGHELFLDGRSVVDTEAIDERTKELYEQIGRLKVENDFLKKKSGL